MYRLIWGLLFLISLSYGDSFVPLHHELVQKLLTSKDFLNMQEVPIESSSFYRTYPHALSTTGTKGGSVYFPQGWMRYKFYVPGGTRAVVVMTTAPNSCLRTQLSFQNPIDHVHPFSFTEAYMIFHMNEINQKLLNHQTIEFFTTQGTMQYEVTNSSSNGGWVYLNMVEDTIFASAAPYGKKNAGYLYFTVRYQVMDKQKFKNWLYNTPLLSENGNPSASQGTITEIDMPAPNQMVQKNIAVDTGNYFYNGPDPFSSGFDSSNLSNDGNINVQCGANQTYRNGQCIDDSTYDPQLNSNTTTNYGSTNNNSSTNTGSQKISCISGYHYNPNTGLCDPDSGNTNASSGNSNTTTNYGSTNNNSSTNTGSQKISCISGYHYNPNTGLCDPDSNAQAIAESLKGRQLPVNGYFSYYGPKDVYDPYAWIFVSPDSSIVAKLDGMDPKTGNLKWTRLIDKNKNIRYIEEVNISNGKIIFGGDTNQNSVEQDRTQKLKQLCIQNGYTWIEETKECKIDN